MAAAESETLLPTVEIVVLPFELIGVASVGAALIAAAFKAGAELGAFSKSRLCSNPLAVHIMRFSSCSRLIERDLRASLPLGLRRCCAVIEGSVF